MSHVPYDELARMRRRVVNTASLVASGIDVKERRGPSWAAHVESGTIVWNPVYSVTDQIMDDEELLVNTSHEAAHLMWTTPFANVLASREARDLQQALTNTVEDIRIERLLSERFPGFGSLKTSSNLALQALNARRGKRNDPMGFFLGLLEIEEGAEPNLDGDWLQFVEDAWPYVDKLANVESTLKIARGVVSITEELHAARRDNRSPRWSNVTTRDELLKDELQAPSKEFLDDDELAKLEAEDAHRHGTAPAFTEAMSLADLAELMLAMPGMHIDDPDLLSDLRRVSYVYGGPRNDAPLPGNGAGSRTKAANAWRDSKTKVRPQINVLSRQLTAKLRANAEDEWTPGMRRGQLDVHSARRSLTGATNIFRERHSVGGVDYAFGIGIDISYSQAHRASKLLDATVATCEAIEDAGLRLAVLTWDTTPSTIKPFDVPLSACTRVLGGDIAHPDGGTDEAPALYHMLDQFERLPRDVPRFFIQLTDGQTRNVQGAERMIEEMHGAGVHCIGVGIACPAPAHYEEQHSVDDAIELARILPQIVSTRIRVGR